MVCRSLWATGTYFNALACSVANASIDLLLDALGKLNAQPGRPLVLFVLVASLYVSRYLTRPIVELARAATRLAKGDLGEYYDKVVAALSGAMQADEEEAEKAIDAPSADQAPPEQSGENPASIRCRDEEPLKSNRYSPGFLFQKEVNTILLPSGDQAGDRQMDFKPVSFLGPCPS